MKHMNLYDIPDHPVVQNMERTGYPTANTPLEPVCPECNDQCDEFLFDELNQLIGCDSCVERKYPEEDEFPECPVCGVSNPEKIYMKDGEAVGCEQCVTCKDAYEHIRSMRENYE